MPEAGRSKPDRVDQILDAALRLFAREGFHAASMDDLVAESGLSKGSLYWYFESKDDIVFGVL
ncbi:MAG: helix-turn-helix domain-containing protein, partial [Anaerolineales bacterium]|nr:helix-turn-helix domain-containing protein [Anaerolineales bacterium]